MILRKTGKKDLVGTANEMILRRANKKDSEGIANVLMQSYNINSLGEGIETFLEENSKKINYVVAEENKKIIGLATWCMDGLPKHGLAEMDRIAVLPEFKGKGIAKNLFEFLAEESKKFFESKNSRLRKMYLLTHESNERAKSFYEKIGFECETKLKSHYYGDKDELVFSKFF